MLNWLASRLSDWKEGRRAGAESETAAQPGDDADEGREDESASTAGTDGGSLTPVDDSRLLGSWRDLLDEDEVPKRTIRTELGLQPHEFLTWLIRDAGGRMWQSDLVETTGWSKSTVSRYLDTLETSGTVERVQIGRRKLVGVPGKLPDVVPASGDRSVDPPSVDTPASSWTPGADERA